MNLIIFILEEMITLLQPKMKCRDIGYFADS